VVSESLVQRDQRARALARFEVGLVEHERGLDAPGVARHEQPVHQARVRLRVGLGEHQHGAIGVRHEHLVAPASARFGTLQLALARLHRHQHAASVAAVEHVHAVAHRHRTLLA
jgi:hypothetical protein